MTVSPIVAMTSAERESLLAHLLKMRDLMAQQGHRHVAEWANDQLIELVDERARQASYIAQAERELGR